MNIELKFQDLSLIALTGKPFGKKIYDAQIKNYFDWDGQNTIIFPNHVEIMSTLFIQGLFYEIFKRNGYSKVIENINIVSGTDKLTQFIWTELKNG